MRMNQKTLATFRIDASQWQAFQQWAKRSGTNASALLVEYIEECLVRPPAKAGKFPLHPTTNHLDKRIDELDKRLKLLETSIDQRIEVIIQHQMSASLSKTHLEKDS